MENLIISNMKFYEISLIILLFLFGCVNPQGNQQNQRDTSGANKDLRTDKEIEDLILKNKSKQLFLSFWNGMDEIDLKRVKGYETKLGNLTDSNFIVSIKMPKEFSFNDDNINNYQFSVGSYGNFVLLKYYDSYFKKIESKNPYYSSYGLKRKKEFDLIKNYLIKLYDSKYERIIDTTDNDIYVWRKIIPEHITVIISLEPYFGFYEKINGKESRIGKWTGDVWYSSLEYREYSNSYYVYEQSKLNNYQLGISKFDIYYETKEEYFYDRDFRANKSKRELMEKTKEQSEKERTIEKSKNNL
jgi:hypothetical protein